MKLLTSSKYTRRWKKGRVFMVSFIAILSLMLLLNFAALSNRERGATLKKTDTTTTPTVQIPQERVPGNVPIYKTVNDDDDEEEKKITPPINDEKDTLKKVVTPVNDVANNNEGNDEGDDEEEDKEIAPKDTTMTYNIDSVVNIPIIVVACKRKAYLERALDSLLKYFPKEPIGGVQFSIIVSRDCKNPEVEELLGSDKFNTRVSNMRFLPPGEVRTMNDGYSAIARHYKWIFTQAFDILHYDAAVIVEEDMEISPDFYEYFAAGYKLLKQDPTLWCISSWNDNGLGSLVSDPYALYRSDFFPGLGWMLLKSLWKDDLSSKWPSIYWDDYIRRSDVRKNRVCIRPELSRTFNFGKDGVSKGQFFSTHLSHISPNKLDIKWTQMDLASKYTKENYDKKFINDLKKARFVEDYMEIYNADSRGTSGEEEEVVVPYKTAEFKKIAMKFGLMEDFKDGVARTAYMGVVTFKWKGHKVNLVPEDFLDKIDK